MPTNEELINAYKAQWAAANAAGDTAGMEAAHRAAEAVRANMGYSGGADGSQYIPLSSNASVSSSGGYTPRSTYSDSGLSSQDKAAVDALKAQWAAAKAAGASDDVLNSIHQQAESIRDKYGYSGGADGSEYIPLQQQLQQQQQFNTLTPATSQANYINKLYEAQREAMLAKLKAAYDQNTIDLNAASAKIPQTYQAARNQTAAVSEQNRAAFNERAAAYGLNSGTGGQADLAMRNTLQNNLSTIDTQEANAKNDIETQRLKLSTAYQNDIAQAIAQGDLARAQALYNEAVRVDNSLVQMGQAQADENYRYWAANNELQQQQLALQREQADTLAAYGDFSGYKALGYTDAQIEQMRRIWAAKNPILAAATGSSVSTPVYTSGYRASSVSSTNSKTDNLSVNGNKLFDSGKSNVDNPSTLQALYAKISQAEDKGTSVRSTVVNLVKNYLNSGIISEATAKKILSNYGM